MRALSRRQESELTAEQILDVDAAMDSLDFGLFESKPGLFSLVHQSMPIIWIGLISLWPVLMAAFLRMIWCVPIPQEGDDGVGFTYRLLPSPDIECWEATHIPAAAVALAGLLVWCVGVPALLACRLFLMPDRHGPENYRRYGFFLQGYEQAYWWWDVIAKRVDVGSMMLIAYTSLVPTPEAKLMLYPAISGIQLFLSAWLRPFTNQQAGLLDVLEMLLQMTRFLLFTTVAAVLILAPHTTTVQLLAILLLIAVLAAASYLLIQVVAQFLKDASGVSSAENTTSPIMKLIRSSVDSIVVFKPIRLHLCSMHKLPHSGGAKHLVLGFTVPIFKQHEDEHLQLCWRFDEDTIMVLSASENAPGKRDRACILAEGRRAGAEEAMKRREWERWREVPLFAHSHGNKKLRPFPPATSRATLAFQCFPPALHIGQVKRRVYDILAGSVATAQAAMRDCHHPLPPCRS